MPQQPLTLSDRLPATEADLTDRTIRDWTKEVLTKYVQHFVGEEGWKEHGASSPAHVVDCIFSQLQVTLLGYASDMTEADSKEQQLDQMLRVRK